jgi:hypothetical protein
MGSGRAAGGGALGPARWARGLHPSRHGRLPLTPAGQHGAARRSHHAQSRRYEPTECVIESSPHTPSDRLRSARRSQGRLTASLARSRCARLLTPPTRRYGPQGRGNDGVSEEETMRTQARAVCPNQLVLWPRHQLTEAWAARWGTRRVVPSRAPSRGQQRSITGTQRT